MEILQVLYTKGGGFEPQKHQRYDYSLSSRIVILPFFAVFTTLRALFITPIPNLESSAEESVSSRGFDFDFDFDLVFVFMI